MKCFWKNYSVNKSFEQKVMKKVGQEQEDITLFIKTLTGEMFRKLSLCNRT
jgi:hypothetical protein